MTDPSTLNHLGKGIFAPQHEATLLADGYIFAAELPPCKGKPFLSMVACKRPISDAVTAGELDSPRFRRTPVLP